MMGSQVRDLLFQGFMLGFYVSFRGCNVPKKVELPKNKMPNRCHKILDEVKLDD